MTELYAIGPTTSTRLECTSVIAVLSEGRSLLFDAGPPREGQISVRGVIEGPPGTSPSPGLLPEVTPQIVLYPGGGSLFQIGIEARRSTDFELLAGPENPPPENAWMKWEAVYGAERSPIAALGVLVDFGDGRMVAMSSTEDLVGRIQLLAVAGRHDDAPTGMPDLNTVHLRVESGGANVVHFAASLPTPIDPIGQPSMLA